MVKIKFPWLPNRTRLKVALYLFFNSLFGTLYCGTLKRTILLSPGARKPVAGSYFDDWIDSLNLPGIYDGRSVTVCHFTLIPPEMNNGTPETSFVQGFLFKSCNMVSWPFGTWWMCVTLRVSSTRRVVKGIRRSERGRTLEWTCFVLVSRVQLSSRLVHLSLSPSRSIFIDTWSVGREYRQRLDKLSWAIHTSVPHCAREVAVYSVWKNSTDAENERRGALNRKLNCCPNRAFVTLSPEMHLFCNDKLVAFSIHRDSIYHVYISHVNMYVKRYT